MSTFSFLPLDLLEGPYSKSLRAPPVDSVCVSDIDEGAVSAGSGSGRREGGWMLSTPPPVSPSCGGSRRGASM